METVQLQCGNCQQVMAIGVEHLGGQVQCPHCRAVVQTPAAAAPPAARSEPEARESIFSGPEATEDVIGGPPIPRMELPQPAVRSSSQEPTITLAPTNHEPQPASDADADLTTFKRRPIHDRSVLPLIAMIFLVPYAICTTLFIIYLLANQNRIHPLDMLPDPVPNKNKGGPRPATLQTIHNHPLAARQKTKLGGTITIGDIAVTPERVILTADGDLQLRFRARNISTNTAFEPMSGLYVRFRPSRDREGKEDKPYTFLEAEGKSVDNLYGGDLEWRKNIKGHEQPAPDGLLGPGQQEVVAVTTLENYRTLVKSITKSNDNFLWRVQVRRGFVRYKGKDYPTTAVFGVEFTPAQIERLTEKA